MPPYVLDCDERSPSDSYILAFWFVPGGIAEMDSVIAGSILQCRRSRKHRSQRVDVSPPVAHEQSTPRPMQLEHCN